VAVIACAALGVAALVLSSMASGSNSAATVSDQPVVTTVLTRDVSPLDRNASESATSAPMATTLRVADRWYEEASTVAAPKPVVSAPPAHDAWYLDNLAIVPTAALSEQARDTWYLTGQRAAALDTSIRRHVADTWYLDEQRAGIVNTSSQRHVADTWYLDPAFSAQGQPGSENR
jgi:hypothetical protein